MANADGTPNWRSVQGFSKYLVSDTGLVWSAWLARTNKRSPIMKAQRTKFSPSERRSGEKNYLHVLLKGDDGKVHLRGVHRLVALAFLGEPPTPKHEVAHNDGNGLNNHVSNLRWATPKENYSDRYRHGTDTRGEQNWAARLTAEDVLDIRYLLDEGEASVSFLAEHYGVHKSSIKLIQHGRSWQHILAPGAKIPPRRPHRAAPSIPKMQTAATDTLEVLPAAPAFVPIATN